jgi:hypothetical protein
MLTDQDIYLVDVIANVIKEEIKTNLPIDVEVQTPFWYIEGR